MIDNLSPFAGYIANTVIDQLLDIPSTMGIYDVLFLIPALLLWLVYYRERGKYTKMARGVGSVLFGFFWLGQSFNYFGTGHYDPVNGLLSAVGFVFFLFIAAQFMLDHLWKENTKSIIWLVRTAALTGTMYFVFEHIPFTQGALIYAVSWLTYFVLILFGNNVSIQSGFPMEFNQGLTISSDYNTDTSISIIFACTAALALFLFAAAVIATRTDRNEWIPWARKELKRTKNSDRWYDKWRRNGIINTMRMSNRQRKLIALAVVVPIIFVTNIFRNVGVISAVYSGLIDFYTAHHIIAKILSLGMMMFLTWVLFEFLPELQENLMGLFDLLKRNRRGMIVAGRMDMKYISRDREAE